MTQDYRRFLLPEEISRISRLEVRARHIVEGFLSGLHRSPYFGQSVEVVQHREYVPGDDIRHIDWKVFGRTDKLYLKQYQEETNLRLIVLVDVSGSMGYGSGQVDGWSKYDFAATLAAATIWLLLTDPVTVADAVSEQDVTPFVRQLANVIFQALRQLVRYL